MGTELRYEFATYKAGESALFVLKSDLIDTLMDEVRNKIVDGYEAGAIEWFVKEMTKAGQPDSDVHCSGQLLFITTRFGLTYEEDTEKREVELDFLYYPDEGSFLRLSHIRRFLEGVCEETDHYPSIEAVGMLINSLGRIEDQIAGDDECI